MQISSFSKITCSQILRANLPAARTTTRTYVKPIAFGCRRCGVPPEPIPFLQDTDDKARSRTIWEQGNKLQYDSRNTQKVVRNRVQRMPNNDHIMRIANDPKHRPPRNGRRVVSSSIPEEKPQQPQYTKYAILRNILKQMPLHRFMSTHGPVGGRCEDPMGGRPADERDGDVDDSVPEDKPRFRGVVKYCRGPSMVVHHHNDDGGCAAADGGPKMCFEADIDTFACCARRRGGV